MTKNNGNIQDDNDKKLKFGEKKKYESIREEEKEDIKDDINMPKLIIVFLVFAVAMIIPFILFRNDVISRLVCNSIWGVVIVVLLIFYLRFRNKNP